MWYEREGDNLKITIYVQPGAKSTEIVGIHDKTLKIRLNAHPLMGVQIKRYKNSWLNNSISLLKTFSLLLEKKIE